jgi:hypothetical protein
LLRSTADIQRYYNRFVLAEEELVVVAAVPRAAQE